MEYESNKYLKYEYQPVMMLTGKTSGFDHPSPEYDKLFKHQIIRPSALSIRIGPKWSRGPFFPMLL
jgi:hypothetical protein